MLKEQEFRIDLPAVTACDRCRAVLVGINWNVGEFSPGEWYGLGIVKCESCSLVRMAAAGSNEDAHAYARRVRLMFISSLNS